MSSLRHDIRLAHPAQGANPAPHPHAPDSGQGHVAVVSTIARLHPEPVPVLLVGPASEPACAPKPREPGRLPGGDAAEEGLEGEIQARRPVLTGPILDAALIAIRERCDLRGGHLAEFCAEADHVHTLVSLPPAAVLAGFVNAVKTTTSRRLRRDFPELRRIGGALWSPSYLIASAGGAPLDRIKEYVRTRRGRTEDGAIPHRLPHQSRRLEGACGAGMWSIYTVPRYGKSFIVTLAGYPARRSGREGTRERPLGRVLP